MVPDIFAPPVFPPPLSSLQRLFSLFAGAGESLAGRDLFTLQSLKIFGVGLFWRFSDWSPPPFPMRTLSWKEGGRFSFRLPSYLLRFFFFFCADALEGPGRCFFLLCVFVLARKNRNVLGMDSFCCRSPRDPLALVRSPKLLFPSFQNDALSSQGKPQFSAFDFLSGEFSCGCFCPSLEEALAPRLPPFQQLLPLFFTNLLVLHLRIHSLFRGG